MDNFLIKTLIKPLKRKHLKQMSFVYGIKFKWYFSNKKMKKALITHFDTWKGYQ